MAWRVRTFHSTRSRLTADGFSDGETLLENELNHERWCNDLAAKFLCVFVLDRFVDFVSDQVRAFTLSLFFLALAASRQSRPFAKPSRRPWPL